MSKKIRSQYIKNLMADNESLSEQLKANTKDSISTILEDAVKDSLRGILHEEKKEDVDFDEKEAEKDTDVNAPEEDKESDFSVEDVTTDTEGGEETEDAIEDVVDDTAETSVDDEPAGEGMWDNLDQLKGDNGEYDLTGMDDDQVIKVLKVMGPEDSVRVVKNDNGSVTLTDDETEKEYVIDIEGGLTNDSVADEESEVELTINEEDLGYTDNYQNKTAMTTPDNHEPGKKVRSWDKGVPQGTEKPWVGKKGDMAPYDKQVNEGEDECANECGKGCIFEVEIDTAEEPAIEEGTSIANGSRVKGLKGDTNHSEEDKMRHMRKSYDRVNENKELANMMRKANAIMNENKELKKIANDLKSKIEEAVVINASLAKVINLVTENSTSRNEKIDILKRFNEVKSVKESNALYETISRELKNAHPVNNTSKLINNQLNESKGQVVETEMYKSDDLDATRDLMRRLDKVKK